jgi:hypothetical protein
VVAVATLLERLDAPESGQGRPKAAHKQDLAALARLATRGYTKDERTRLAGLVATARTVTAVEPISDDERSKILLELYGWLTDWATQAKRVIKKRQHLITLGLAARKKPAKAKPAPVPVPAPTPKPADGAPAASPSGGNGQG